MSVITTLVSGALLVLVTSMRYSSSCPGADVAATRTRMPTVGAGGSSGLGVSTAGTTTDGGTLLSGGSGVGRTIWAVRAGVGFSEAQLRRKGGPRDNPS